MKLIGHGFNTENIASVVIVGNEIVITYYDGVVHKEDITDEVIVVFDKRENKEFT